MALHLESDEGLFRLAELFVGHRVPQHIRSDSGLYPEVKRAEPGRPPLRVGVQTLFITAGSPWEIGDLKSVNGKLQKELLKRELFDTLEEMHVLVERWRQMYNRIRPHRALGYGPHAPESVTPRCA